MTCGMILGHRRKWTQWFLLPEGRRNSPIPFHQSRREINLTGGRVDGWDMGRQNEQWPNPILSAPRIDFWYKAIYLLGCTSRLPKIHFCLCYLTKSQLRVARNVGKERDPKNSMHATYYWIFRRTPCTPGSIGDDFSPPLRNCLPNGRLVFRPIRM